MSIWIAAFVGATIAFWAGYYMGRRRGLQMRREEVLRREKERAEKLKARLHEMGLPDARPSTRAINIRPTNRWRSQVEPDEHSR